MKGDGSPHFAVRAKPRGNPFSSVEAMCEGLSNLTDRLRYVQLLNRPAESILERMVENDKAVIYADPPYSTADTTTYNVDAIDKPLLLELFAAQRGKVAISGYNDEWDTLGWERHEEATYTNAGDPDKPNRDYKRVEVLWTNYPAGSQTEFEIG